MTLTLVCLCDTAAAHIEDEMRILRMYYEEKDLVISATRHPKPISQVAENITVVTAKEIEEMNAHTVAEVLNRLTGLFVKFNQDAGAAPQTYIQGSEERHVLVLVDGVPWNLLNNGAAVTNSIPVGIIQRVEVIKGPASSAWGSSLGGVVNIITKRVGDTAKPAVSVRASYGERKTQDYRAELSGLVGPVGYYLFAGRQASDGLRSSRYCEYHDFYSKIKIPISKDVNAGLSIGYSKPHIRVGDFPSGDITTTTVSRNFFATTSLDASLFRDLNLILSLYHFKQKFVYEIDMMGLGPIGFPGERYRDDTYDEETTGGSGKLVWKYGNHTAVLGVDIDHGKLDQEINAGPLLRLWGAPPIQKTHPDIKRRAVYANDTIVIDSLSITPGIRYDHNNITGSFTSPSLGLTYSLGEDSIIRGSVARGFTIPPLSMTSGGGLFVEPNPDLEPEKVWSYQAGAESSALKYVWLKATLFRHDMKKAIIREPYGAGPPTFNDLYINQGKIRRQGFELEVETMPIYNFSLLAGVAFVHIKPSKSEAIENYTYNIGVRYDDGKSFHAQLFGHYIWWDLGSHLFANAEYDDFIWDLNLNKEIYAAEEATTELFFTAHNIFNSSQYAFGDDKNPQRWVEAGVRVKF